MIKATSNVEDVIKNIETIEKKVLSDLTPFWETARKIIVSEAVNIFRSEGYGTWAPLSERYRRIKPADKTILRLTDKYYHSVTRKNSAGNIFEAFPDHMEYGVDIDLFEMLAGAPYPLYHEKGTSKMPARPVFGLLKTSEKMMNNMVKALKSWLYDEVKKCLK